MGTIMGNGVTIRGGSRAGAKISTTLNEDGTQNIYIADKTKTVIDTTIAIKALFYNGVSVPLSSGSDVKILAGTYTFKNTLTSVSSDVTGSFVFSTNSINMIKMVFTTKNILQYWKSTSDYTPSYDNTSWRSDIFKTVIIPYDTIVDTDFYTWFTSNTTKIS